MSLPTPHPTTPDDAPQDGGPVTPDPWTGWRSATPARIALGRAGVALPTAETLRFGWAHALARDAIHTPLDVEALEQELRADGWTNVLRVASQAAERSTYLRRPDLGRRLDAGSAEALERHARSRAGAPPALVLVIGDGLSSRAAQRHARPLLQALCATLPLEPAEVPLVIATQARVALSDEIGHRLGAELVAILLGERPGLSSPDSLGIYLTHAPRPGRSDAERNCISNVRPEGLSCEGAAWKLAWLMRQSRRLGMTGVALKDESDLDLLEPAGSRADGG